MKNRIAATICALLAVAAAASAQESDIAARFSEDIKANAQVTSIECAFTQTVSMSVLAQDVSKGGHFSFSRPSDIRLDFTDGDYIHMTGDNFEMRSEGHTSSMKTTSNPMLKELRRILSSCMSGDVETIMSGFNATVTETASTYGLTLTPKDRRSASMMSSMEMQFSKKDMSLDWMKMNQAGGNSTRYTFTDKKIGR